MASLGTTGAATDVVAQLLSELSCPDSESDVVVLMSALIPDVVVELSGPDAELMLLPSCHDRALLPCQMKDALMAMAHVVFSLFVLCCSHALPMMVDGQRQFHHRWGCRTRPEGLCMLHWPGPLLHVESVVFDKKANFGRFPGRAARHPLSPHLLHPHLRQPNLEFPNAVVLKNAVVRRTHKLFFFYIFCAKERKCPQKSANASPQKGRKRAQKGAKERKRALTHQNCKQPGLKTTRLGNSQKISVQNSVLKIRGTICAKNPC